MLEQAAYGNDWVYRQVYNITNMIRIICVLQMQSGKKKRDTHHQLTNKCLINLVSGDVFQYNMSSPINYDLFDFIALKLNRHIYQAAQGRPSNINLPVTKSVPFNEIF